MWLTNLRIVLPDGEIERGAIRVAGDRIAEVVRGSPSAGAVVDGAGMVALPGLIDVYGDLLEREVEPRPGSVFPVDAALHELDKRLAGAGVTTACATLTLDSAGSTWRSRRPPQVLATAQAIREQRADLLVDMHVHLRCLDAPPGVAGLLDALLSDDLCRLVGLRGERGPQPELIEVIQPHSALLALHDPASTEEIALARAVGGDLLCFPRSRDLLLAARQAGLRVALSAPNVVRGGSRSGGPDAAEAIGAGLADILVADESPIALLQAVLALAQAESSDRPPAVCLVLSSPALIR